MRRRDKSTEKELLMYNQIELWKQSGLNQQAWCGDHNISYSKFKYWQKKYKASRNTKQETGGFIDLNPEPYQNEIKGGLVLHYPNGVQLHVPGSAGADRLMGLIRLY